MLTLFVLLYVVSIVVLIVSILMQSGRGSGLSGAFGSSWEGGVIFGGRGAGELLTKITTVAAVIFGALTLVINIYLSKPRSVLPTRSVVKERAAPVAPAGEPGEEERLPVQGGAQGE